MAGEIPPLAADRLAAPDWPAPQASQRFSLPAVRVLETLDEGELAETLPEGVLAGLQHAAAAGDAAGVLLAPERGLVVLLVDGRRAPLAGAARDAVLTLLGEESHAGPGSVPALASEAQRAADLSQVARAADVDAQVQLARGRADAPLAPPLAPAAPLAALRIGGPLLAEATAESAAARLGDAVDGSGLFLEAHVAQWLRGERALAQVLGETERLAVPAAAAGAPDQRAAQQLEALQRQAIALSGQAWEGQPMRLEIERDCERHREAANAGDATGLFVATLRLQLPRLGELRARIRVVERTVGIQLESAQAAALQPELMRLHDALAARGLQVAQLDCEAVTGEPA